MKMTKKSSKEGSNHVNNLHSSTFFYDIFFRDSVNYLEFIFVLV